MCRLIYLSPKNSILSDNGLPRPGRIIRYVYRRLRHEFENSQYYYLYIMKEIMISPLASRLRLLLLPLFYFTSLKPSVSAPLNLSSSVFCTLSDT